VSFLYLRSRFVRFLVSLRKSTQHANRNVYAFVPDVPLDCEWTDEKLYKRYGLNEDEIAFIESMVRPMPVGAEDAEKEAKDV
jgi:site-specific DNA-methyltransferase (adenine-specific)